MLLTENKNWKDLMDNKDWIAEFKRDGNYLTINGERINDKEFRIHVFNRKNEIYSKEIPKSILDSFNKFSEDKYCKSFTICGELVYVDKDGKDHRTQAQCPEAKPYFMAFDIMELNNEDLCGLTWKERKHELIQLFFIYDMQPSQVPDKGEHVILIPHYTDKKAVLKMAENLKLEGIVLKHVDGKYVEGRSKECIKIKFKESDEFIVIGYVKANEFTLKKDGTKSKNKRFDYFGALMLAQYKAVFSQPLKEQENDMKSKIPDGFELVPMGRVGGGFTDDDLNKVTSMLHKEQYKHKSLSKHYPENEVHSFTDKDYRYAKGKINWLPKSDWFVIEINMSQRTEYGKPFQPTFLSVRDDKEPSDCVVVK